MLDCFVVINVRFTGTQAILGRIVDILREFVSNKFTGVVKLHFIKGFIKKMSKEETVSID